MCRWVLLSCSCGAGDVYVLQVRRHLPWLYPLLNELITTASAQVRAALALVYAKSIGQLLPLQAQR